MTHPRRYCFITGFLRSGTTLVEKLVHALPDACIGPQPFPFLYYDTKRDFLRSLGLGDERYPLGSLFREERYQPADFDAFLAGHRLTPEAVAASFAAMQGYRGWKLPAIAAHAGQVREGVFADVYRQLCDSLPAVLGREASLLGAKEVFCEEFTAHFLANGVSVILVLRDVRDVVTSLKFGSGSSYVNAGLSMLHIVRQWRKSVAYALQFSGRLGFEVVRYEELVAQPRPWLDGLARRLGSPPSADGALDDLRDQEGGSWEGNSSFAPVRGVSRESVGRFAEKLPPGWLAAIEALGAPEMRVLGLEPAAAPGAWSLPDAPADEMQAEQERLGLIANGRASEAEQRRWFIFPRAYERLAATRRARGIAKT
jgi:hypothetical protein